MTLLGHHLDPADGGVVVIRSSGLIPGLLGNDLDCDGPAEAGDVCELPPETDTRSSSRYQPDGQLQLAANRIPIPFHKDLRFGLRRSAVKRTGEGTCIASPLLLTGAGIDIVEVTPDSGA